MQRVDTTLVSTGVGLPIYTPIKNTDWLVAPFQLSIAVISPGGITYSVQYTYDDFWSPGVNLANINWFNDVSLNNATVTGDTTINDPVTGWRIGISAGTGTLAIKAIQGTMIGGP